MDELLKIVREVFEYIPVVVEKAAAIIKFSDVLETVNRSSHEGTKERCMMANRSHALRYFILHDLLPTSQCDWFCAFFGIKGIMSAAKQIKAATQTEEVGFKAG